jgi:hypothetical protein
MLNKSLYICRTIGYLTLVKLKIQVMKTLIHHFKLQNNKKFGCVKIFVFCLMFSISVFSNYSGGFVLAAGQSAYSLSGNALEFDGVNDYVKLIPQPKIPATSFTQEFWMLSRSTDNSFHGIIGGFNKNTTDRCPGVWVWGTTTIHYGFGDGSTWHSTAIDGVVEPNVWHHIAVTFDGTDYKLYVNGVLKHNYTGAAGHQPDNLDISWIGRVDNYFHGMLDEVRIWGVARTEEEIRSTMCVPLVGDEDNLIAYYDFNADNGNRLANLANGSNNAILTNMKENPWVESQAMIVPGQLVVENISARAFTVRWDYPEGVTTANFVIDVALDSLFSQKVQGYSARICDTITEYVSGLMPDTEYFVRVRVYNDSLGDIMPKVGMVSAKTLLKDVQFITFDSIAVKKYGDAEFSLSAEASSGLELEFSSSNAGVAVIEDGKLVIKGAGLSVITATQPGGDDFEAATSVQRVLMVEKAVAEIIPGALQFAYAGSGIELSPFTLPEGLSVAIEWIGISEAPEAVGTYTVKIEVADDNYTGLFSGEVQIVKATPLIAHWPQPTDIIPGEPVCYYELCGGEASVEGDFVYVDENYVPVSDGEIIPVKFIPADTVNYRILTGNVKMKYAVITHLQDQSIQNNIKVFPSVISSELNLHVTGATVCEFVISDPAGRVMLKDNCIPGLNRIDFSAYTSGVYIIAVYSYGKKVNCAKFIKK